MDVNSVGRSVGWSISRLAVIVRSVVKSVGQSVGWSVCWLFSQSVSCILGWLVACLLGQSVDWSDLVHPVSQLVG